MKDGSAALRFFNTYEPVTSIYRDLVPVVARAGHRAEVWISRADYRERPPLKDVLASVPGASVRRFPNLGLHVRHGTFAKAVVALLYFLTAGLTATFGRSRFKNVFFTQPPFIAILGTILKRLRGQPYYTVLMDIQPQMACAVGLLSRDSFVYGMLDRLHRWVLSNADGVIVIGRCMRERVQRMGIPGEKVTVIPNWSDTESVIPVAHTENSLRNAFGWNDDFVVMYAGNIGYPQPFDSLLRVAGRLTDRTNLRFVIIGEGSRKEELEKKLQNRNLANLFTLLPYLHDRFEISEILSAADIHYVPLHPDVTGFAVPSKTYSILASGRPVIFQGREDCEIARLVREENVGWAVGPSDDEKLERVIRNAADAPGTIQELGSRARRLACGRCNKVRAMEAYAGVLLTAFDDIVMEEE